MISFYCWNPEKGAGVWLDPSALTDKADQLKCCSDILWIDLENPTPEEEQLVFEKFFPVHFLTLEDVTRLRREPDAPPHLPKVEEFPEYLLVIVNPLTAAVTEAVEKGGGNGVLPDGRGTTQLSAVLTHTMLITHHYDPLPGVTRLRTFVERHDQSARRGPDYLFHLILDDMVDQYAPLLDHFGDVLEEYEEQVFKKPKRRMFARLLHVKRAVLTLRKTLVYEREILARLSRGEFSLIDEREMVYYRNVYDHLLRFTELIETTREMTSDLMQTHLTASANRLNEVMKVLTMISTTILPMTLIAGIYGMNFDRLLPASENPAGFWIALALMALTGVSSYLYFKWRKWD